MKINKIHKTHLNHFLTDSLITIAVIVFLVYYIVQPTVIDGHSMEPTLYDHDQLIIEKVTQRIERISRNDIIVFRYNGEDTFYIKRVIGMPNEIIDISDGYIYIDGTKYEEELALNKIEDYGNVTFPVEIPDDAYFVLGDNRNKSKDSRYASVGFVEIDDIEGRAFIRLWPFNRFGLIK